MSSRADIAAGKGFKSSTGRPGGRTIPVVQEPVVTQKTLVLPNASKMCAILCFFLGSFAIGLGAGFGLGWSSKDCITA